MLAFAVNVSDGLDFGSCAPFSRASYEISRSIRCWGSTAFASSVGIKKNLFLSVSMCLPKVLDDSCILTGASNALTSSFKKCAPLNEICNGVSGAHYDSSKKPSRNIHFPTSDCLGDSSHQY